MAQNSSSMTRSTPSSLSRDGGGRGMSGMTKDQYLDRAINKLGRAAANEQRERAAQENMTQRLLQTATIFGTPALLTFLQVKGMLPASIMNVPVALAGGVLFRGASEFMDGMYGDLVRNIGDGMLAQYGTVLGSQLAGGVRVGGQGASVGGAAVGCGPVGCGSPAAYMGAAAYPAAAAAYPAAAYAQPQRAAYAPSITDEDMVALMNGFGWTPTQPPIQQAVVQGWR